MGKTKEIVGIVKAKQELNDILTKAAATSQQSGQIPTVVFPETVLERPQNSEHGDYASSFPLKLARVARLNPLEIANKLVANMKAVSNITDIEVAPPGFINFTLKNSWLTGQVNSILSAGENLRQQ